MFQEITQYWKKEKKREEKLYVFLVGPLSETTIDSLLVLGLW